MDIWSNSGKHRLASLRCGHLFGYSCIARWLQVGCSAGQRRCPQCNKSASLKHIRFIYARKLQTLDTAENDRLKAQVETLQIEKNQLQLELAQVKLQRDLQMCELSTLKLKCEKLEFNLANGSQPSVVAENNCISQSCSQKPIKLMLDRTMEVCKNGGCRVLAYNLWHNLLVVSQSSTNSVFSGFGIRKIDAFGFRPQQFMFLHPKPIRDMNFHPQKNELLLSVSFDRSAKLLDITCNAVVHTYTTDNPLWSCCWDDSNPNMLFVGSQNGVVTQFDLRQTGSAISRLCEVGETSPVTSLTAFPSNGGRVLPCGGFLACRLNSCWAYEQKNGSYISNRLPLTGPFTSMTYDKDTDHILVSTRPNTRVPNSNHILCQFAPLNSNDICLPVHTFLGSCTQKFLSRPCTVSVDGQTIVAAHIESSKIIALWSVSSGQRILSLPVSEPIIDLCPVKVDGAQYLAGLSEKELRIYKFYN